MYSEEVLRQLLCYHCAHCVESRDMRRGRFLKRKCALTNRWGSMEKAFFCRRFENRRDTSSDQEVNGYRIRKDQVEDYRTEKQWLDAGFRVKPGAEGTKMHATRMAAAYEERAYEYYLPEQVVKI